MEIAEIKDILLDCKHISEVEIKECGLFHGKSYSWIIHCKLDVLNRWIPIVIGIPQNWKLNLFDFYLIGEIPFIPHIDTYGKLCLFNLEGVLIYPDFRGLFNTCVTKAIHIISDGLLGKNRHDFLQEFDSYIGQLSDIVIANVALPRDKKSQNIKICKIGSNEKRRKNESYAQFKTRTRKIRCFASVNQRDFKTWGIQNTQENGLYFFIEPSHYIYPPNIFENKIDEFLNDILSFVDIADFKKMIRKCSKSLVLIFEILQDKDTINSCGFIIDEANFSFEDKIRLISFTKIQPILINRIDEEYMSNRTSFSSENIGEKSILLVGCGSIGGYVFHDLIKSGFKNITLVDDDLMNPENVYRHFLGIESVFSYKAKALENYAKKTVAELNIKTIIDKIEYALDDYDLDFNDFDYIVSAIGNHTTNQWINEYAIEKNIDKTFFYIWNEPLDIGCHVARINLKDIGNYQDIFLVNDNGVIDLSSYALSNQSFAKNYSGCNGSFIPYGSSLSVESSVMFLNLLKREIEGQVNANLLASKKGNDYYFEKAGFLVSNRYTTQCEQYVEVEFDKLKEVSI